MAQHTDEIDPAYIQKIYEILNCSNISGQSYLSNLQKGENMIYENIGHRYDSILFTCFPIFLHFNNSFCFFFYPPKTCR